MLIYKQCLISSALTHISQFIPFIDPKNTFFFVENKYLWRYCAQIYVCQWIAIIQNPII